MPSEWTHPLDCDDVLAILREKKTKIIVPASGQAPQGRVHMHAELGHRIVVLEPHMAWQDDPTWDPDWTEDCDPYDFVIYNAQEVAGEPRGVRRRNGSTESVERLHAPPHAEHRAALEMPRWASRLHLVIGHTCIQKASTLDAEDMRLDGMDVHDLSQVFMDALREPAPPPSRNLSTIAGLGQELRRQAGSRLYVGPVINAFLDAVTERFARRWDQRFPEAPWSTDPYVRVVNFDVAWRRTW